MAVSRKPKKSAQKLLESLWLLLVSPRLGIALISTVTVFVVTWHLGWKDIFESVGFIFALAMLAANLLCFCVETLSERESLVPIEAPGLATARGKKARCLYFTADLAGGQSQSHTPAQAMSQEDFPAWVRACSRAWPGRRVSKLDTGGEGIQFHVGSGIRRSALIAGYHAAVLMMIAGGVATYLLGRSATVVVHEGARSHGFEKVRAGLATGWIPYQERGRVVVNRVHPGFDVEVREILQREEGSRARLLLLDDRPGGTPSQAREIVIGKPESVGDSTIHLTGVSKTGRALVALEVTDQHSGKKEVLSALQKGSQASREGFQVRITGIQDEIAGAGTAVQLQYQEQGRKPETFWVFQEFPDSDLVMRKKSRFVFRLESLRPLYQAQLVVSHDPGAMLVLFGGALFVVFFLASLVMPREQYWFMWDDGKVWVVGSAPDQPIRLGRVMSAIQRKLQRRAHVLASEVKIGSL